MGGGGKTTNLSLKSSVKINTLSFILICALTFELWPRSCARYVVLRWITFVSSYFKIYTQMIKLQVGHDILFTGIIWQGIIVNCKCCFLEQETLSTLLSTGFYPGKKRATWKISTKLLNVLPSKNKVDYYYYYYCLSMVFMILTFELGT